MAFTSTVFFFGNMRIAFAVIDEVITVGLASKAITFTASQTQPDTNYVIVISPHWGTTWWITVKATTGFTMNFGTVAPAAPDNDVDWFLLHT